MPARKIVLFKNYYKLHAKYNLGTTMDIIQTVKDAWGWTGIAPVEVVTENDFANFILKDEADKFWRLCPEDVYCKVVADSIEAYNKLITDEDFVYDWFVDAYVEDAKATLGELTEGQKYTLIIPGALDGDYDGDNMKIAPIEDIICASGALGKQIKDLPDGSKIAFDAAA
ncbi:MAG: DUF1851 domain-containing protein [uncultured Thiotrichaceae bacterium]|uniref:DUF1851 domain-containing protein n=1 Tax=uncultured Thiotrichaceae bacterium TaxID=298394 RepID=A0A6S6U9S2_9GAMM|nr:MAG: DUF1851 domain-containing protein [uncultured Thiotrichaceae bacterium]